MNVLAIGGHPDDLELLCGGTLGKYAQKGNKVYMASLTNGDKGHARIEPAKMAKIRKKEFEKSASVIGAEVIWLGIHGEMSEVNLKTRLKVVNMLRKAKPDIIITHDPKDYHVDHRNTSQLVFEATPLACVYNIKTEYPVLEKQPLIYYMDNLGGINFTPTEYVEIDEVIDIKKEMLGCHKSQIEWTKELTGFDLMDVIETVAKFRGYACGANYAEGFRKLDAWYRGTARRVLP